MTATKVAVDARSHQQLVREHAEALRLVRLMANLIEDWDASMDGDGQPLVGKARALLARVDGGGQ